jgi:hypothetical protein
MSVRTADDLDAIVAEIKSDLAQWLARAGHSADDIPTRIALLELACERYLDDSEEAVAASMINSRFHRIAQKRSGKPQ